MAVSRLTLLPYCLVSIALMLAPTYAHGQTAPAAIPGSADPARFDRDLFEQQRRDTGNASAPSAPVSVPPALIETPEGAEELTFTLSTLLVTGSNIYTPQSLAEIWEDDIGRDITLTRLYEIASEITARYRADGYVLSRAYIPAQEIDGGIARINVVEGYVATVEFKDLPASSLLDAARRSLTARRPLNIKDLERQMLLLNDLPGYDFRAVLQPQDEENAEDGGAVLAIVGMREPMVDGAASVDNSGSRYIGPWLSTVSLGINHRDILPFQRTEILASTSLPADELKFGSVRHEIPLNNEGVTVGLNAGYSLGRPGFLLKATEIETKTVTLGADISLPIIRQRDENLTLRAVFDSRNSTTDVLDTPFTKDKIRAARLGLSYDKFDSWKGYNQANATVSRGLDLLGASEADDPNLTRAQGRPDFTKLELSAFRSQALTEEWSMLAGISGQIASDALLSAEEYGYGGTTFGRAFNPSEILGDDGFSALAELRYQGWKIDEQTAVQPFAFYDFGKVWNRDPGQEKMASGASIGAGVRLDSETFPDLTLTLAQPLTRRVDAPQYGNGRNPRLLFSMSYRF